MKLKRQYMLVAICLFLAGISVLFAVRYFLGTYTSGGVAIAEEKRFHDICNRKEIIKKIDNYRNKNGRLPASLSELGFEQQPALYKYGGNSFWMIRSGWHSPIDYILEYWDMSGNIWQYSYENRKWYDEVYFEFEPPINIDTIRGIYNAYYAPREPMHIQIDSLRKNSGIVSILDYDNEVAADSLAYLRYYSADTPIMEGWVTYQSCQLPGYLKEFGIWKYYDGEGNCYFKFWNYKQNEKLIYEADR